MNRKCFMLLTFARLLLLLTWLISAFAVSSLLLSSLDSKRNKNFASLISNQNLLWFSLQKGVAFLSIWCCSAIHDFNSHLKKYLVFNILLNKNKLLSCIENSLLNYLNHIESDKLQIRVTNYLFCHYIAEILLIRHKTLFNQSNYFFFAN